MRRPWLIFLSCSLLAACASNKPAPVADGSAAGKTAAATAATGKSYVVKKGDTLHSIALDHGIDYRDLIIWNGIDNPNRIRVGQNLRVGPAGGTGTQSVAPSGAVVQPIASNAPVASRSLEERPLAPMAAGPQAEQAASAAPAAVPPAPTFPADSDKLKRSPKGGKLPYSPENLARLKAVESAPPLAAPAPPEPAAPPRSPLAEKPAPAAPAPIAAAGTGQIEWAWPSSGKIIANFTEGGSTTETNKGLDFSGKLGDPVLAAAAGKVIHVGSEIRGLGNFVVIKHNQDFLSVYGNNSRILVKQDQTVTRGQKIAELGNSDADQPKLHFEVRQQGKPVDPLRFLPPR